MKNKLMNEESFLKAVKKGVEQRIREYANGDTMVCNFEVIESSDGFIDTDTVVENINGYIDCDCNFDFGAWVDNERDEKTGKIDFDKMLKDVIDDYCSDMGQYATVIDYMSIKDYEDFVVDSEKEEEE